MFFSPLSIGITLLGEERANISAFRTFVRFALVWFWLFPLPLGGWEGLRLVIVTLPELFFFYLFFFISNRSKAVLSLWYFFVTGYIMFHILMFISPITNCHGT